MPLGVLQAILIVYHAALCPLLAPVVQMCALPTQEAPPPGQVQISHPLPASRAEEKRLTAAIPVVFTGQLQLRPLHTVWREYLRIAVILVYAKILPPTEYPSPCAGVVQFESVYTGRLLHLLMGLIPPPVVTAKIHVITSFCFYA